MTRIKGDLSPLLNLSQDPEEHLARLAEQDGGDEVGVLIGGLSGVVQAQGLLLCKAIGGSAVREIAHMSDSAIDHIDALLAILLSLSLTQGPGGGAVQICFF